MMVPAFLLFRAVAVLLSACSLAHAFFTDPEAYEATSESPYQDVVSNPELKPPQLLFNDFDKDDVNQLADGSLFIALYGTLESNQTIPSIFDMTPGPTFGTLVWTGLNYTGAWDFRPQTYKGEPHLTFFLGELLKGFGHGTFYLLDTSYQEVARFDAVDYAGRGDLHEFQVTEDDHGLILVYTPTPADLTAFDGPSDGWVHENIIQEIDIETNELVFSWNATDHVALNETYDTLNVTGAEDDPFDYMHINSVDKDANGDYLMSARVMHCIYKISGEDGSIIWRLGGKLSDFEIEPEAEFAFQHDARWIDSEKQDRMTLFDNGPHGDVDYSRGLLLAVDQEAKTVRLVTEFKNPERTFNIFSGNMHAIDPSDPDTNFLVGFGTEPWFGEFSSNGTILLNGQFGATSAVSAYRTFKLPWKASPLEKPSISWNSSSEEVYASWNGATEHRSWILYTADSINATTWANVSAPVDRIGFETGFDMSSANYSSLLRVRAVDEDGETLGWSDVADGDGNIRQAASLDDDQLVDQLVDPSAATNTSSSSTPSNTSDASPSSTPTDAGTAVNTLRGLEIVAIGIAVVGFCNI